VTRRLFGSALCIALLAAACGDGRATESDSGAAIRWIDVDAKTNRFNASFLSFFPDRVTVRPGDTVIFRSIATGEPHSVTMGTLVDRALAPKAKGSRPSLPKWTLGTTSRLPPNVGRPCYLEKGAPPKEPTESCEVTEHQRFNGRQTYYSSGFLPEDTQFRVDISPRITPATYRFFCNFHGSRMSGAIKVVEKDADIPSQGDVDAEAKQKLRPFVDETLDVHAKTYEPYEDARAGRFPWPALASFDTNEGLVKVLEFVPFTLKAKEGERVRWNLLGAHTIAFDAPENARPPAIRVLSTGETELKADAVNESRSREPPVGAPRKRVVVRAPPYDEGFMSSGMLYSPKRGRIEFAMTFSEPGSYRYQCLLHPRMTGLVIVSV
jgi:plastocyanin